MLLDVLSGLDELRICTAYEIDGVRTTRFPGQIDDLKRAIPVYESLPGWHEDISGVRTEAALPANTRRYIARIGELLGRPVTVASVGPDRSQTIVLGRSRAAPVASHAPRTPAPT